MSVAAYGVGRNLTIVGGYAAYGFGILDLFPDGIIAKFGIIVYKELRDCLISVEDRNYTIEEEV